jgi:hypothetical protein
MATQQIMTMPTAAKGESGTHNVNTAGDASSWNASQNFSSSCHQNQQAMRASTANATMALVFISR